MNCLSNWKIEKKIEKKLVRTNLNATVNWWGPGKDWSNSFARDSRTFQMVEFVYVDDKPESHVLPDPKPSQIEIYEVIDLDFEEDDRTTVDSRLDEIKELQILMNKSLSNNDKVTHLGYLLDKWERTREKLLKLQKLNKHRRTVYHLEKIISLKSKKENLIKQIQDSLI